jgi:hypothetical protein
MTDDTIRYLADWAGWVLLISIGVTGFLVFIALMLRAQKK